MPAVTLVLEGNNKNLRSIEYHIIHLHITDITVPGGAFWHANVKSGETAVLIPTIGGLWLRVR